MQNAAQTYFKTQFSTMGQGEVLLLLYDGALKFLAQAKEKIRNKDMGGKGIALSKALDIVAELDATLNLEVGGELAQNLHQLYMICSTRLLKANLKLDIEIIDGVIDILEGLRSAYAEILNRPEAQQASEQIAAKRKAFNVKGKPNATMQPIMPPGFGSGGRAQSAYATAARQVSPADAAADAPAPTVSPQPSLPVQNAQASLPPKAVVVAADSQAAASYADSANSQGASAVNGLDMPLGSMPSGALSSGARRSATMAAYGRVAQITQP